MKKRKLVFLIVTAVLALNLAVCSIVQTAHAAMYQKGSSGSVVTQIQTKLKNWGYYNGTIDGIFGSKTEAAVELFQRKNGLTVDGKVGAATLRALGIQSHDASESVNADVELLARLISAESRGEPYSGQVAVGAVVLNRIRHPSFPNTLSGVIYQTNAFSCIADGQFNEPIDPTAYKAARDALNGVDPSGGALYYYNPAKATSSWIWSREVITVIGEHYFCL